MFLSSTCITCMIFERTIAYKVQFFVKLMRFSFWNRFKQLLWCEDFQLRELGQIFHGGWFHNRFHSSAFINNVLKEDFLLFFSQIQDSSRCVSVAGLSKITNNTKTVEVIIRNGLTIWISEIGNNTTDTSLPIFIRFPGYDETFILYPEFWATITIFKVTTVSDSHKSRSVCSKLASPTMLGLN